MLLLAETVRLSETAALVSRTVLLSRGKTRCEGPGGRSAIVNAFRILRVHVRSRGDRWFDQSSNRVSPVPTNGILLRDALVNWVH